MQGKLTLGQFVQFSAYIIILTWPLISLGWVINLVQRGEVSMGRLNRIFNLSPTIQGPKKPVKIDNLKGDIVFDRVSFRYAPDLPNVLKEISCVIPGGTTMGVVGPSGSGKTTLTRLLQKAYFPSSGTIRISDCYLNEIDTAHLRRHSGVVLQESFLFRASVAENIRAGQTGATREQIIQASLMAGADEFIVNLPQAYDTLLEEGARNLSGGQRQRLAIARALLTRPDILILDEATSSLDPESERIVRENLGQIARNRTTIIVSHRLSMLIGADRILVLENGMVVGFGPHAQLLQECALYKKLWRQQMELQ